MGRLFGTDGVRGLANSELTGKLAFELGQAGAYVLTMAKHKPRILIGRDTRISGDMLEAALIAGICSVGAEAIVAGVIPTPAVAYLTRHYGADAGVVISASHNSMEYNGIKFLTRTATSCRMSWKTGLKALSWTKLKPCLLPSVLRWAEGCASGMLSGIM